MIPKIVLVSINVFGNRYIFFLNKDIVSCLVLVKKNI